MNDCHRLIQIEANFLVVNQLYFKCKINFIKLPKTMNKKVKATVQADYTIIKRLP